MKKLSMQTRDIVEENIAKIAEFFPHVVIEKEGIDGISTRAIDFQVLRNTLSGVLAPDDSERYRLDWPGKRASLLKANTSITKTLRPDRGNSVNFDTAKNLFIEGDNFEVLKILQESYLGKVKMIYIDPPYNTGKDFVYKDNFTKSRNEYEEEIGLEDENNGKLFRNTDTNGRFHSDWLSMMYERLFIARDLLKEDGAIFISIDDNEVNNLRKIADEIFGENNFVGNFIRQSKIGGGSDSKHVVKEHEYCVVYAKNISQLEDFYMDHDKDYLKRYKEEDNDGRFFWDTFARPGLQLKSDDKESLVYEIELPNGIKEKNRWIRSKDRFLLDLKEEKVRFLKKSDGAWSVQFKQYLNDDGKKPRSLSSDLGSTIDGKNDIKSIFDNDKIFSYPKPIKLVKFLASLITDKTDIVLDFFAGSATTAHAVMDLNLEDGGDRKFIMVQIPEEIDEDSEAYKAGYKYISDISKERIRRAGKKILEDNTDIIATREKPLDIGFRVYKVDTTNMKDVYYHPSQVVQDDLFNLVSNIKEDRTPEDLLTQVILNLGLTLDLPVEKKELRGNGVYFVAGNALVACFDDNIDFGIVDDIAKYSPYRVVFKDASFREEQDRTNVDTRMKRLSPETIVTVL